MLLISESRKIDDIVVYQDDADWTLFYPLPSIPSIREDKNGRPIFLLALYHLSDQAREENKDLPRGGGYMSFDVQFALTEAQTTKVRQELQAWVDQEHARRLARMPRGAARASSTPPQVKLADPLLSGGKVTMHTTQSEVLTTNRFAEAPASLVSGSTAVFNIDLTEHGASFMKQLMVDDSGAGNIDLTPVQVIYDLQMWARMPPIKITVTGKSERIHKTLQKISETNQDNPCTSSEVETYRETGVNSSNLKETGSVDVKVDKGDATVPDDVVDALQQYALDLFDTMVEERFLVPAESDEESLEFDSDDPEINQPDPGWGAVLYKGSNFTGESVEVNEPIDSLFDSSLATTSSSSSTKKDARGRVIRKTSSKKITVSVSSIRVRPGHRVTLYKKANYSGASKQITASIRQLDKNWQKVGSVKIWRPPTARYKVRKTVNHSTMNLEITVDRSQVIEWPLVGQATLQTFFADSSPEEIKRHVVEIFADDFNTLGVEVRAFVDFENTPIRAVEIQTEYSAKDSNGETRTSHGAFTFQAGETNAQQFDPTIVEGEKSYRFRYKVFYDDGTVTEPTRWETTTNRDLNVTVVDPGRLELEVSGASLNWDILRGVMVQLSYAEPGDGNVERTEQTFELTKLNPVRKWDHRFRRAIEGHVEAQITYSLVDDKVVQADPHQIEVSDNLFVVPPPQVDVLNVTLVPAGDWSDVAQAVVSLTYDAGEGHVYDETARFTSIEQSFEWEVLLRDPTHRTFKYQTLIVYKSSGDEDKSEWQTATGDQALAIFVPGVPKLRVNVLSNLVDFSKTPVATVSLSYGDERQTLSFTSISTKQWEVELLSEDNRAYAYEITWHTTAGDEIKSGVIRTEETELFIPRARMPMEGKLEVIVRGFAVDFTATPFVDVALSWTDIDREERKTLTLSQAEPNKNWTVDIGDRQQRRYKYAVTYNLADGTRVPGASGETDDPVLSITRYQP